MPCELLNPEPRSTMLIPNISNYLPADIAYHPKRHVPQQGTKNWKSCGNIKLKPYVLVYELLNPEPRSTMLIPNIGNYLPADIAYHPKRHVPQQGTKNWKSCGNIKLKPYVLVYECKKNKSRNSFCVFKQQHMLCNMFYLP